MWYINEENIITVIAPPTSEIKVYKKLKNTNSDFEEMEVTVKDNEDNFFEITATIVEVGIYILKIEISKTELPLYTTLEVKDKEQELTLNKVFEYYEILKNAIEKIKTLRIVG